MSRSIGWIFTPGDFLSWLCERKDKEDRAERLTQARKARDKAYRAYAAAKLVGDTREIHATHKAYREATAACLKVEVCSAGSSIRDEQHAKRREGSR